MGRGMLFFMRLILLCVFLAGCSTTMSHPTKSTDQFYRDEYECQRDSAMVKDSAEGFDLYWRCMRSKGWRPVS